jgi:Uma2 family endonuclease
MPMDPEYWLWDYLDESGKRKRTGYRLTQRDALDRYGPSAKRVEGSREVRTPLGHTSDWLKPSSRER